MLKYRIGNWIAGSVVALAVSVCRAETEVILVTGAGGGEEYAGAFAKQAAAWKAAAEKGGARLVEIGTAPEDANQTDVARLQSALSEVKPGDSAPLWIVFNGHGTWDGRTARFNLRGPDVAADDLAAWLKPVKRPLVVINTASSSAPFLTKLTAPGRVIVTATRSGSEQNYTRFGGYFASALTDAAADLDTDGAVSVLEAFLAASRATQEFYKAGNRLASEHALIEDNGDGMGTPADWFRGLRAVKKADKNAATDGAVARRIHLISPAREKSWSAEALKKRESLEERIAALREVKDSMKEEAYLAQLEPLLLELARLTASEDAAGP